MAKVQLKISTFAPLKENMNPWLIKEALQSDLYLLPF
jgi:hypothetical protein